MLLNDEAISRLDLVKPFYSHLERKGVLSYGLSSFGYDIRLDPAELIVQSIADKGEIQEVDPKNFTREASQNCIQSLALKSDANGTYFSLPPYSHGLGVSMEWIEVPNDCLVLALKKSTYIRCGLSIPTTVLEPGWKGYLTLEMVNCTPHYHRVYAYEGICQLVPLQGEPCRESYENRKYQHQPKEVTFPTV